MTFFAHHINLAIGGSYMMLLNTFANLGGTWISYFMMYLIGKFTVPPNCTLEEDKAEAYMGRRYAYVTLN